MLYSILQTMLHTLFNAVLQVEWLFEYIPLVVLPLNILLTALLHRGLVIQSGNIRNKKFIEIATYIAFVTVLLLSASSAVYWFENTRFFLALNLTWMVICIIFLIASRNYRRIVIPQEAETLPHDKTPDTISTPESDDKALENLYTRKRKSDPHRVKNNLSVYRKKKQTLSAKSGSGKHPG